MKTCKTCGLGKELSCFWRLKTGKHGVQAHCIDCAKIRLNKRYLNNRQQCLLKAAEYRKTEAGQQSKKRYSQSDRGRERNIKYLRGYRLIDEVRKRRKANLSSFREKAKQNRMVLTSGYVKQIIKILSGGALSHREIPDSLMEIKKQSLFLKRLLKQKKQQNEQYTTANI